MQEEDIPFVLEIENLSFSIPWHEAAFRGEIGNFPFSMPFAIVHKAQKKVIGYIILWNLREEVQISNFAVHPSHRRMKIGERVLRRVLTEIQKQGAKYVFLEVRPSNAAARSLYGKLGFRVVKSRKDYYSLPTEDALIMGKWLGGK